ncbi:MAG: SDR family NAD(P)-dependent oxidoreductase [Lysobacterales bacterium]
MAQSPERLAVVTGGIGGLGTEICVHLARAGRRVVAADLDHSPERIAQFREDVSEFNGQIQFEALNVADFDDCAEFAARVHAHHGPVDILVNAAGITRDTTLRKMEAQHWNDVMRVNAYFAPS